MNTKNRYFTSPIYYANSTPHLGHLYTSMAVDILDKLYSLFGYDTYTSYGTDEHGQKVESAALKEGLEPQAYVDQTHLKFKELLLAADIKPKCFTRTTDPRHKAAAIDIWNRIYANGFIYEGEYKGWYSQRDEAFYKEDEIENGCAKETGSPVEMLREKCFFFKLSSFKDFLLNFYKENPSAIRPKSRYAEVMGMLVGDLPDLAVSRSRFKWGIQIPSDPEHIMYVWIDALSSYLSSLGYPANPQYQAWWKKTTHIIGKDILKFHAIYFPAILKAAGIEYSSKIFAHGWWMVNNKKMSKSVGNVVDPFQLLENYGSDQMRYFLFKEVTFGTDGSFAEEDLVRCINSELVNELGNLVQRVLMFCYNKYSTAIEPAIPDRKILDIWDSAFEAIKQKLNEYDITFYVQTLRSCIIATNKYIDEQKPWSQPDPKDALGTLCICIRKLAILGSAIAPKAAAKLATMLHIKAFNEEEFYKISSCPIAKPTALFQRIP